MNSNIGRFEPIKLAFMAHLLQGIDEIIAVDDETKKWLARERKNRVALCPDRMLDSVESLLSQYHRSAQGSERGIHSPLPVILVAFAKDSNPISPERSRALPNPEWLQLEKGGQWYKMRTDFVEQRIQLAFLAHTSETAKAMTSQMRLYFSRFGNYRFPIKWQFGGYEFVLSGTLNEIPPSDDLADLPERTNLTVLIWNITLEVQIPYLTAPQPHTLTEDGKIKGYETLNRVDFDINGTQSDEISTGVVDTVHPHPEEGDWAEK